MKSSTNKTKSSRKKISSIASMMEDALENQEKIIEIIDQQVEKSIDTKIAQSILPKTAKFPKNKIKSKIPKNKRKSHSLFNPLKVILFFPFYIYLGIKYLIHDIQHGFRALSFKKKK